MNDLVKRMQESLRSGAIDGDQPERGVVEKQFGEAIRRIVELEQRLVAAESHLECWKDRFCELVKIRDAYVDELAAVTAERDRLAEQVKMLTRGPDPGGYGTPADRLQIAQEERANGAKR